jgi:hypothetical protein
MESRFARVSTLTAMIWLLGALPSFGATIVPAELGRHELAEHLRPVAALSDVDPTLAPATPLIHLPGRAAVVPAPAAVRPPLSPDIPALVPVRN